MCVGMRHMRDRHHLWPSDHDSSKRRPPLSTSYVYFCKSWVSSRKKGCSEYAQGDNLSNLRTQVILHEYIAPIPGKSPVIQMGVWGREMAKKKCWLCLRQMESMEGSQCVYYMKHFLWMLRFLQVLYLLKPLKVFVIFCLFY